MWRGVGGLLGAVLFGGGMTTALRGLVREIERLEMEAAVRAALAEGVARLRDAVRARLSEVPEDGAAAPGRGAGVAHAAPWLRSGALLDSVSARVDGDIGVVGSSSEVALFQERGTASVPPRPFLAPAAAEIRREVAAEVGAAAVAALRR